MLNFNPAVDLQAGQGAPPNRPFPPQQGIPQQRNMLPFPGAGGQPQPAGRGYSGLPPALPAQRPAPQGSGILPRQEWQSGPRLPAGQNPSGVPSRFDQMDASRQNAFLQNLYRQITQANPGNGSYGAAPNQLAAYGIQPQDLHALMSGQRPMSMLSTPIQQALQQGWQNFQQAPFTTPAQNLPRQMLGAGQDPLWQQRNTAINRRRHV